MKRRPARRKKARFGRKSPVFFIIGALVLLIFASYFYLKNTPFCANSISCIKNLSGNYESEQREGEFEGKKIEVPPKLASNTPANVVLGENTGDKHIYIDLTHQRLYATEGNTTVYNFPISSGKWAKTPTGDFSIWVKLRYTRMEGGNPSIGTYYNLPNVPFTMFIYNSEHGKTQGYSIHGAYWHNNFGHPMSHGCINMRIEDAQKIYEWSSPPATGNITYVSDSQSTPITITGETPNE